MLREQTERLSRMVRTLLDMSELKTVPRNDRIQLAPMIEEVLADLSPLAEKSGVTLSQTGDDLWITGSDVLVYRAIFNLVENGVKYNHPGGSAVPSQSDLDMTAELAALLSSLEVALADHIIVADGETFSLYASELIQREYRNGEPVIKVASSAGETRIADKIRKKDGRLKA